MAEMATFLARRAPAIPARGWPLRGGTATPAAPMARTIHFVSLGCAKNRVDTEVMLGVSGLSGFEPVEDPAEAEVIVVNTCGFIGPAKEESVDTILAMGRYKEAGSCHKLVVAGCLSQRYPDELAAEMPEVDHFLGSSDMLKLEGVLGGEAERMLVGNPAENMIRATDPRRLSQWGHSAYVKIAEVDGLSWVRLHYLYPETLSAELLRVIAEHPKVLPYVDMPLQHASDAMLRRMRRGHGGDRLYRVVDKLREAIPDLVFRTTFIVGHPGETDADFDELVRFVEWAEFDHVGVFLYSHEEGTHAGTMDDAPDAKVARARHRKLMATQRPISRKKLKARIGTEIDVLVDGVSDESEFLLEGRWWGQAPEVDGKIYLANGTARPGELRRALVTSAADYDLVADLLTPEGEWQAPPGTPRPKKRRLKLRTLT